MEHSNHKTSLIIQRDKTFWIRKTKITVSFSKKSKFCVTIYFFFHIFYSNSSIWMRFICRQIMCNIGYLEQTGKKNCSHLYEKYFFFTFFLKYARKLFFIKKSLKVYFIDGACLLHIFQWNLHCIPQNKTRKRKFRGFLSRQNYVEVLKYMHSKILPDLVIMELIPLNGW